MIKKLVIFMQKKISKREMKRNESEDIKLHTENGKVDGSLQTCKPK